METCFTFTQLTEVVTHWQVVLRGNLQVMAEWQCILTYHSLKYQTHNIVSL